MHLIESQPFPSLYSIKISIKSMHIGIPLYEKFRKMSFQNRYMIPAANGVTTLSVPLKGGRENSKVMAEVEIDNSQAWQTRHWRTITAAYNRSPYFDYYEPGLRPLFEERFGLLHEWNLATLQWTLKKLEADTVVELLRDPVAGEVTRVAPRNFQAPEFTDSLPAYRQVFMERHGFIPNVSSLDLIFCCGSRAGTVLLSAGL
jgi:hypothetical protein